MTFDEKRAYLNELNEEALLADGFEDAFVGIARQFTRVLALYDYDKCLDILMKRDEMDQDTAEEYMEFNVLGAWVGENTPVFITSFPEGEHAKGETKRRMEPRSGSDPRDEPSDAS